MSDRSGEAEGPRLVETKAMGDTNSRETWTAQVSGLAYHELYAEGEDMVTGYDASGSCLWGAPRPTPPLELVDPARRWRGVEPPATR